jgi:hypothetical protein
MASHNPIYTPEGHPELVNNRATGKRVLDLRDDGKWHDISAPQVGKGSNRRPGDQDAYREGWERIFGDKRPRGPQPDPENKSRGGCDGC